MAWGVGVLGPSPPPRPRLVGGAVGGSLGPLCSLLLAALNAALAGKADASTLAALLSTVDGLDAGAPASWQDPAGHLLSWCLPPAACPTRPPWREQGGQRAGVRVGQRPGLLW